MFLQDLWEYRLLQDQGSIAGSTGSLQYSVIQETVRAISTVSIGSTEC